MELTLTKNQIAQYVVACVLILLVVVIGLVLLANPESLNFKSNLPTIENCVPTFRDGGGPYYKAGVEFRDKIVPDTNSGQPLIVEGYIFDTDCTTPVADAVLDIWQASEEGEYEDEYYRGRVRTDSTGYYKFETVMPLGYGEGTAYRPPHIHFKVFVKDVEIVTSQMFFEDVTGREGFNDEYIIEVDDNSNTWRGKHNFALPDYNLE